MSNLYYINTYHLATGEDMYDILNTAQGAPVAGLGYPFVEFPVPFRGELNSSGNPVDAYATRHRVCSDSERLGATNELNLNAHRNVYDEEGCFRGSILCCVCCYKIDGRNSILATQCFANPANSNESE